MIRVEVHDERWKRDAAVSRVAETGNDGWAREVPVLRVRCRKGHRAARLLLPDVPGAPLAERAALGQWVTVGEPCPCLVVLRDPLDCLRTIATGLRKAERERAAEDGDAGPERLTVVRVSPDDIREPTGWERTVHDEWVRAVHAGNGGPFDPATVDRAQRRRDGTVTDADRAAVADRARRLRDTYPDG